jgi:ribosomal protein L19E
MRTKEQEVARWTWLTPAEFGERFGGVTDEHVRRMIADGTFRKGEVLNVARGRGREYRISHSALDRLLDSHDASGSAA